MITTGCEGCCFLKKDEKGNGCALRQVCVVKDGQVYAPGYCRLCRSNKWAKKQDTKDFIELNKIASEERTLKFDLLIFFDEAHNTVVDLEKTLNSDWYLEYAKKIIIMDVTGFGKRKNLALQYLNSREHPIPIVIDSSTEHESVKERSDTIRRVSQQVDSDFFMVIPAGNVMQDLTIFARMIKYVPSRVIHWSFPFTIGSTAIVPLELNYGLFITQPYRALTKSPQAESFTIQLKKEEAETEMGLTWFCTDLWLT